VRAALLACGCALLAALGWLLIAARPQPVASGAAAAPGDTAAAAPPEGRQPALPTSRRSHPALPDPWGRERFLASAEDKWQRMADEAAIAPDRAARGWEVIRRYREAVYPQLLAASREHERSPAADLSDELAYLDALYYGPAALAARRRALEELAAVMPADSFGWVREVEPSLFPEAELAAARRRAGAGAED
jgi:hypothetical protein